LLHRHTKRQGAPHIIHRCESFPRAYEIPDWRQRMSFLDNLENDLKALENREERDPEKIRREQEHREVERTAALLRAPHAEALRTSPFTMELLTQCRAVGHRQRVLVQFTWLGENLRMDAKEKRMELVPTAEGITAVLSSSGEELVRIAVDPEIDDAAAFARRWLTEQ
jgi:hypothetical protein